MEIIDVETYALHMPIDRAVGDSRLEITDVYWVVVELKTDAGHTGTGWMGSLGFAPDLLEQFINSQFVDILVGADPFCHEAINEELRSQTIYYGELGMSAWPRGAIDVALWDIKAKTAGQPLYKLLGGEATTVPAYVSSMDINHELNELGDLHRGYAEKGFTAFKTKAGNRTPESEAARIKEIRQTVGQDADILVDANQAWTVKKAIQTVDAMAEHDIAWVEEPISEFDLDGHARVAERINPPLATGEMLYRPVQFERFLKRGGMEVAQPDLVRNGGITGGMAVANLAAVHNVPFAPHFYYAISAHLVSAASTGWIVEYIPEYDIAPVLKDSPMVANGQVHLPDRPGHGYRIDPEAKAERLVTFD